MRSVSGRGKRFTAAALVVGALLASQAAFAAEVIRPSRLHPPTIIKRLIAWLNGEIDVPKP